jgi:hypothetical protein
MTGRKHSEEFKIKISDAHKGLKTGENHPMYNKPKPEGSGMPRLKK